MNKNDLDEMQLQKRNHIGNQAFLMLMYLLIIDAGLYGFGFRWINYPANIMIIITVCSAVYVVRLIRGNAYTGPSEVGKPVIKSLITIVIAISIIIAIAGAIFAKNMGIGINNNGDNIAAPIVFIFAAIAIVTTAVIALVKRRQKKDDDK